MSTTDENCLDGFPIRADVAGPGVRAAFYIQTVSTILFVWLSPKDVSSSHWSMVSTALGLSVAGIVTGVRKEISLVDALIIIDAVLLAFYACDFMNSEFVSRMKDVALLHRRPSALWVLCSTLCSLLSCTFGLYVWATAPTFGAAWYECNGTMKVTFLGLDLQEGRKVQLVLWAINALLFVVRTCKSRKMLGNAILELFFRKVPKTPSNLELLARLSKERPPFWSEFKVFGKTIKPPRVLLRNFDFIWALMFVAFTIISTEVMIKTYTKEHNLNTEWNFGQVLPVLLTLAPVFSLIDVTTRFFRKDAGDVKVATNPRVALAQQFSATLFLSLWCSPMLRKELLNTLNLTRADLKVLESLVAEAYERWDSGGRSGDLKDAWVGESDDEDEDGERFNSIYFDAKSYLSVESEVHSTQGSQFAAILWDSLHRLPGLRETLFKCKVVDDSWQLESLRVIVAQTWDLWKAHRERTKRFRWLNLVVRPNMDIRNALVVTNRRVVRPVVPGLREYNSLEGFLRR
ncbi:hypothetical protein CC2G_001772 [Coprinopsis cinerea AmutBmut pab1-1]|nr:hypothetical protein CC2G_001772 [Coprinopsis cinerea AmutBmut pab1-1]